MGAFGATAFGSSPDDQLTSDVIANILAVCNQAVGALGQKLLTDIDGPSLAAQNCRLLFEPLLRECMRDHNWNFATVRAALDVDGAAPVSRWPFSFELPDDYERAVTVNDDPDIPWAVEGNKLMTVFSSVVLAYVRVVPNPMEWDSMFYTAFVLTLAGRLAMPVTGLKKLKDDLVAEAAIRMLEAKAADGQEQGKQPSAGPTDLLDVRRSGN